MTPEHGAERAAGLVTGRSGVMLDSELTRWQENLSKALQQDSDCESKSLQTETKPIAHRAPTCARGKAKADYKMH